MNIKNRLSFSTFIHIEQKHFLENCKIKNTISHWLLCETMSSNEKRIVLIIILFWRKLKIFLTAQQNLISIIEKALLWPGIT